MADEELIQIQGALAEARNVVTSGPDQFPQVFVRVKLGDLEQFQTNPAPASCPRWPPQSFDYRVPALNRGVLSLKLVQRGPTCAPLAEVVLGEARVPLSGAGAALSRWVPLERKRGKGEVHVAVHASPLPRLDAKYALGDTVGAGACATVRAATERASGRRVAVKVFDKARLGPEAVRAIEREAAIMCALDHPNIVRLLDVYHGAREISLVMDLVEGGELYSLIASKGPLCEREAARLFRQVASAVAYMHGKGIAHRDLKPENVLLARAGANANGAEVRLCDFGVAKDSNIEELHSVTGSTDYVAPEVLTGSECKYTTQCDVWSLGVLLYVMLSGSLPFGSVGNDSLEVADWEALFDVEEFEVDVVVMRRFMPYVAGSTLFHAKGERLPYYVNATLTTMPKHTPPLYFPPNAFDSVSRYLVDIELRTKAMVDAARGNSRVHLHEVWLDDIQGMDGVKQLFDDLDIEPTEDTRRKKKMVQCTRTMEQTEAKSRLFRYLVDLPSEHLCNLPQLRAPVVFKNRPGKIVSLSLVDEPCPSAEVIASGIASSLRHSQHALVSAATTCVPAAQDAVEALRCKNVTVVGGGVSRAVAGAVAMGATHLVVLPQEFVFTEEFEREKLLQQLVLSLVPGEALRVSTSDPAVAPQLSALALEESLVAALGAAQGFRWPANLSYSFEYFLHPGIPTAVPIPVSLARGIWDEIYVSLPAELSLPADRVLARVAPSVDHIFASALSLGILAPPDTSHEALDAECDALEQQLAEEEAKLAEERRAVDAYAREIRRLLPQEVEALETASLRSLRERADTLRAEPEPQGAMEVDAGAGADGGEEPDEALAEDARRRMREAAETVARARVCETSKDKARRLADAREALRVTKRPRTQAQTR
eukprot:m51a1_g13962 putative camk camk1 protein kinase (883) ;mRNA; f:955903-964613